jgi:glycosyltransferase involved in cell wall biosynthesis
MEQQRSIICIGTPAWEGNYVKSTVQLLSELAADYRILYVDYQYTMKDIVTTLLGKQHAPLRRMAGIDQRLREIRVNDTASVHVLTPPPVIPVNWITDRARYNAVQSLNAKIIGASIRSAMKQLQMEHPIVINAFNPSFGLPLAGRLDESLLVYYCYDNISAAPWLGKHGGALEEEFVRRADLIVTSSEALTERFPLHPEKTVVVKNGVDFELMKNGFSSVRNPQRPVAGYIGSIDERLDYELLDTVISRSPETTFRFIGRCTQQAFAERLLQNPNVELLGPQSPASLPDFLRDMDVCLIPFALNDFNRSIYPLKVNEYLAAGKPVVMTRFAHLPEFGGIVLTADSAASFHALMEQALASDSHDLQVLRQEFARYQSWTERAKDFSNALKYALQKQRVTGA